MKVAILGCCLALAGVVLQGCGGGGGGGSDGSDGSPTPAPGPITTITTTTTTTAPQYGAQIKVVNYNLFWWCVSGNTRGNPERHGENCAQYRNNKGWQMLYDVIKAQMPFDLIGFSECEDINHMLNGLGLAGSFGSYLAPPQGWGVHDSGFLYNKETLEPLGEASADKMCHDMYGDRWLGVQRFKVKKTGQTLLYGNTHGGLGQCGGPAAQSVYDNFLASISKNRQEGDSVVVTGDFNCRPEDLQMKLIEKNFTSYHDTGPMLYDKIIRSNWVRLDEAYSHWQKPSDHAIISNKLSLPQWESGKVVPDPPPAPSPGSPTPPPPGTPKSKCKDLGCEKHDATCWCQDSCVPHNSCCDDFQDVCKGTRSASFSTITDGTDSSAQESVSGTQTFDDKLGNGAFLIGAIGLAIGTSAFACHFFTRNRSQARGISPSSTMEMRQASPGSA